MKTEKELRKEVLEELKEEFKKEIDGHDIEQERIQKQLIRSEIENNLCCNNDKYEQTITQAQTDLQLSLLMAKFWVLQQKLTRVDQLLKCCIPKQS